MKRIKQGVSVITVLLTSAAILWGCAVASERDSRQELIKGLEKKYGESFTLIEDAGGGNLSADHCAVYVRAESLPDERIYAVHGVFDGKTTGTPISLLIRNTSQRSGDYGNLKDCFRPGHADYTYYSKFGFRDYRGGGRASARETAGRVAAGAIAAKFLRELGVDICAFTKAIGPIQIDEKRFDKDLITKTKTCMPDAEANEQAMLYLKKCMEEKDSAGGVIECVITGVPAGIGDPVFDKLDARIAQALMSIGAVKAVEIGDGVQAALSTGSFNNDQFYMEDGTVSKHSNHAGGILGGISDGSPIVCRAYVKPTPSIFREQMTVDENGNERTLLIKGRHDPVVVPRAVVVVECMCALTVLDAMLSNMTSRADSVRAFYNKRKQ